MNIKIKRGEMKMALIDEAKDLEILSVNSDIVVPKKSNIIHKTMYSIFKRFMDIVLSVIGLKTENYLIYINLEVW